VHAWRSSNTRQSIALTKLSAQSAPLANDHSTTPPLLGTKLLCSSLSVFLIIAMVLLAS
jgi:hypothetical protein